MSLSEARLPISIAPFADESGFGFCLRSISGNGATLLDLRRLVGIGNSGRFAAHNALHLGRLFQQSSDWLMQALPTVERARPYQRDCYGHRWFTKNNLRTKSPQVCVQCIHVKGYCRAIWDVSVATVCLEHQCYLTDHCFKCRKPLRWDRPRIDIGHCGHILMSDSVTKAPIELLEFQALLEKKFDPLISSVEVESTNSFISLDGLSLSGVHAVIAGFGFISKPFQVMHAMVRTKAYCTNEWSDFVQRGLCRWSRWSVDKSAPTDLSALVLESLLEHMAFHHESLQDQQYAVTLLESIFGRKFKAELGGHLEGLSQMELF